MRLRPADSGGGSVTVHNSTMQIHMLRAYNPSKPLKDYIQIVKDLARSM